MASKGARFKKKVQPAGRTAALFGSGKQKLSAS
jgi:hypothetical protein